ncbi:uncharacterized protein LOC106537082 [Austrofundulus limnaeus]|uniref:Uncharacterized protein LOC106537082 n=1 Tax=Austrofundulus limnaeus TaxID=52670 RepID=A0A2I4DCD3_AUSLI|nr:PREDICTED: uncharacterized protein LOC106537082 [Austrofundulus limnaeus]
MMELLRSSSHSDRQVSHGFQAPLVDSGSRGRPNYNITREQLTFLKSCGFTTKVMAEVMNVSVRTIKRRIRKFQLGRSYADLTDAALDDLVQQTVVGNDLIGPESVRASLRSQGINIQRRRVRDSMIRINPSSAAFRALSNRPQRRSYQVAGPNSLWHLDGNHKLIRWRIVIHGAVDGFSRLILFLQASNNNRSSTVLSAFVRAIARYGPPSRVRTDRGGENNSVCAMMNIFRGHDRGSALRGRSTHNQRIERLWRDLWRGMTNVYYDLFHFLESEGIIDADNEMHIWALHYVYLPRINRDLQGFIGTWNHHGLRTEHHLTPTQSFVRGYLQQQRRQTTAMQDMFGTAQGRHSSTTTVVPQEEAPATSDLESARRTGTSTSGTNDQLLDWPERVTVPPVDCAVPEELMDQITAQFDPLGGDRADYGLHILTRLILFLESAAVV